MAILSDLNQTVAATARDGRGIVLDVDRSRSVKRARRHSSLVRTFRLALPVVAVGIVLYYIVAMLQIAGWSDAAKVIEIPRIVPEQLTMNNPRYRGYTKDGGEYDVSAATAQQDFKVRGVIRMNSVAGELRAKDATVTRIAANKGEFDSANDKLQLSDDIRVDSSSGGWARLTVADIALKAGIISSDQPVTVGNPSSTIHANSMTIRQKTKEVTFAGAVKSRLQPPAATQKSSTGGDAGAQPSASPTDVAAADAATGDTMSRMFASGGNGPIEINSERLDIDDVKRTATFIGNVVTRRGTSTLTAPELRVEYSGSPSGGLSGGPAKTAAGAAPEKTAIKTIVSMGPVSITNGNESRITGSALAYDADSGLATLSGGVVVDRMPATRIVGRTATFDSNRDVASVAEQVVITAGADRSATGDRAELDNKNKTALITGEVVLTQGPNVLRGRRLAVDQGNGRSQLTAAPADGGNGRITARLQRPVAEGKGGKPHAKSNAEEPSHGGLMAMSSFKTDSSAPVDVVANSLDTDDKAGKAVFRGDVVAEQGGLTMRSQELHASYSGSGGITAGIPPATDTAPGNAATDKTAAKSEPAKLTKLQARGKVVVTSSSGQKAAGDWADFDTITNKVTLGGDVVLTQARNVVRGTRLVVDLATGEAVINTDNAAAPETGPEKPGNGWQASRKPSRPSAVFFPNTATGGPPTAKAKIKHKQTPTPAGSAWQATTNGTE